MLCLLLAEQRFAEKVEIHPHALAIARGEVFAQQFRFGGQDDVGRLVLHVLLHQRHRHTRQPAAERLESVQQRAIERAEEIFYHLQPDTQVVGIDEVQFLGPEVVPVCEALATRGLRVICAGLDQDFQGKPFEPMPHLLAIAEFVTKELAICVVCGNPANRSQRIVAAGERVVVGAAGAYEARCRKCHVPTPVEATPPQTLKLFEE